MRGDPRIIRSRAFVAAGLSPVANPCIVARGNLGPDVGHSVGTLLDKNRDEPIGPIRFQPVATRENAQASDAIQISRMSVAPARIAEGSPYLRGDRDVPQRAPGSGHREINQGDDVAVAEHHVFWEEVVVADDEPGIPAPGRNRRVRPVGSPFDRFRRAEANGGFMKAAKEGTQVGQRDLGHRPRWVRRQRHLAFDVGNDISSLVVHTEIPRRAVEPDRFEMDEQRPHGFVRRNPPDGVTDADGRIPRVHASAQWYLRRHETMVTDTAERYDASMGTLQITVGDLECRARWEPPAPRTIEAIRRMLPIESKLIHCRWTGESTWIPFGDFRPGLEYENHTSHPAPGQLAIYPGGISECEIFFPYGGCTTASKVGQLAANHFATVVPDEGWQDLLREIGRRCLWEGAQDIRIVEVED